MPSSRPRSELGVRPSSAGARVSSHRSPASYPPWSAAVLSRIAVRRVEIAILDRGLVIPAPIDALGNILSYRTVTIPSNCGVARFLRQSRNHAIHCQIAAILTATSLVAVSLTEAGSSLGRGQTAQSKYCMMPSGINRVRAAVTCLSPLLCCVPT